MSRRAALALAWFIIVAIALWLTYHLTKGHGIASSFKSVQDTTVWQVNDTLYWVNEGDTLSWICQILNRMKTNGNDPITAIKDVAVNVVDEELVFAGDSKKYDFVTNFEGLTKREYFAAMAMHGMLANEHGFGTYNGHTTCEDVNQKAIFCIAMADALIEALNKDDK